MKKSPCTDCLDHGKDLGCHGHCNRYLEWSSALRADKEAAKRQRDIDNFVRNREIWRMLL